MKNNVKSTICKIVITTPFVTYHKVEDTSNYYSVHHA